MKLIRSVALVVGVLGVAFVAGTQAAEAGAITQVNHRTAGSHDRYGRDHYRGHADRSRSYRGYPRPDRYYRNNPHPAYGYPVVVGGYRTNPSCNRRGTVRGYVAAPVIGFSVGAMSVPPTYRDDEGGGIDDRYSDEQGLDDGPDGVDNYDNQNYDNQNYDDQGYDDQDSDGQSDDQDSGDDYDE
jgi:hypothetical protein